MLTQPDQIGGLLGPSTRQQVIEQDDFCDGGNASSGAALIVSGTVFGKLGWRANTANSGTITYVTTGQSGIVQGVLQLETVTNAASLAAFARFPSGAPNRVMATGQRWVKRWKVNINTLSTVGDRFVDRCGFINSIAAAPTEGAYFEYSDNLSTGNWRGIGMKAGVATVASGGTPAPVVAASFVELMFIWNGTSQAWRGVPANTGRYFVNGASIGDVAAANFPTNPVAEGASKIRSAGTAQRLTFYDYVDLNLQWDPQRAA